MSYHARIERIEGISTSRRSSCFGAPWIGKPKLHASRSGMRYIETVRLSLIRACPQTLHAQKVLFPNQQGPNRWFPGYREDAHTAIVPSWAFGDCARASSARRATAGGRRIASFLAASDLVVDQKVRWKGRGFVDTLLGAYGTHIDKRLSMRRGPNPRTVFACPCGGFHKARTCVLLAAVLTLAPAVLVDKSVGT